MNLKEKRPLIFFDCETTGVNLSKDKIVQIAIVKVDLVAKKVQKVSWMFNPGVPIPKVTTDIHGITNEMVADKPKFESAADAIMSLLKSGVPAGYNINTFDIPLVKRELSDAGKDISFMNKTTFETLDVFKIVKKLYKRSLSDMYLRYTGKELDSAHDALADTMGAYELLASMLKQEETIPDTVKGINEFYFDEKFDSVKKADIAGKLAFDDKGRVIFNFGKHFGELVGKKDQDIISYAMWIINSPDKFAKETIEMVKKEINN